MLGDQKCETKFDQIPLSNNTMARRVEELFSDVHRQVTAHVKNCNFFHWQWMNPLTFLTAQVAVFVRPINDNFEVIEELLGLESMHATTKGIDLFETLKLCVEKNNIEWTKLDSVCTDVAPALTGKKSGCLALLEQFLGPLY